MLQICSFGIIKVHTVERGESGGEEVSGWSGGQRQSFVTAISHSASVMTRLGAQMISSTGVAIAGVTTNSSTELQEGGHSGDMRRRVAVEDDGWGLTILRNNKTPHNFSQSLEKSFLSSILFFQLISQLTPPLFLFLLGRSPLLAPEDVE